MKAWYGPGFQRSNKAREIITNHYEIIMLLRGVAPALMDEEITNDCGHDNNYCVLSVLYNNHFYL